LHSSSTNRPAPICDAPAAREPALGRDPGDDLTRHVLAQEAWEVVRLPARAVEDEVQPVDTLLGPQYFARRRGVVLQPEREPGAVLEHIRRTIGDYNFAKRRAGSTTSGAFLDLHHLP